MLSAVEEAVAHDGAPCIPGAIVAEQDIVGAVTEIVRNPAADLMPADKAAAADRIVPGISGLAVPEKNVRSAVTGEIANADNGVVRIGADRVSRGEPVLPVRHLLFYSAAMRAAGGTFSCARRSCARCRALAAECSLRSS
jgi:hypothetical protein